MSTRYEVKFYDGERWHLSQAFDARKLALEHAELLNKEKLKWSVIKITERREVIGRG